ncbi:MAG: orotate phosphoribosyltransferase [Atribacterota bacterium]|nr:orotate phosphoribosyltransferase [Atribacterota bacterium]MDD4895310.1 orotate phosphoribosyltransferase [Atribacterota bacterium]MDD5636741.1 orotate phosphoribosyltransferase [Atribacterota bacterium]
MGNLLLKNYNMLSFEEREIWEILNKTGAILDGHFLLSSGIHSDGYIQCARILQYPSYAKKVLELVVEKVKHLDMEIVVGPALGGIIVAYELGRQLNKKAMFAERKDGIMQLRRGFVIKPGEKVLITEDVVTTGKSTIEVKELVEKRGANVIGVACIVDRRSQEYPLKLPLYSALQMNINTYTADVCPLCRIGKPLENPGSRFI